MSLRVFAVDMRRGSTGLKRGTNKPLLNIDKLIKTILNLLYYFSRPVSGVGLKVDESAHRLVRQAYCKDISYRC